MGASLGHFVVSELVDVIVNRRLPTHPRSYSFGNTHFVSKKHLAGIIQTIVMLYLSSRLPLLNCPQR